LGSRISRLVLVFIQIERLQSFRLIVGAPELSLPIHGRDVSLKLARNLLLEELRALAVLREFHFMRAELVVGRLRLITDGMLRRLETRDLPLNLR
jgi:hypothetical protein